METLESANADATALFRTLIVNANDAIMITDADLSSGGPHIVYVNAAFAALSGYDVEEVRGRNPRFLQGRKTDRATLDDVRQVLERGGSYRGEIVNYTKDGREYWVSLSIFPLAGKDGAVRHFAAIQRDVTELKVKEEVLQAYSNVLHEQQDDLLQAKLAAEQASEAKTDFLANMSHELRTPLNSILGMMRMLLGTPMTDEQKELASTVFQSSTNLLEIVNDILDLSKIEAKEVILEHIGFDLRYTLNSACQALERLATEKRLDLVRSFGGPEFPYVLGDPTRLGRILTNLISNAIKYTLKGHIEVKASVEGADDGRVMFLCQIVDTGIGIPASKHAAIFDKFVQADNSTTRKFGGTGLGLAITKELVELMGGQIGVDSEIGKGSTFWIKIPFATTDRLDQETMQRRHRVQSGVIPAEKARVLIAEDHPLNQTFMRRLMKKFGIGQFDIAENGAVALDLYGRNAYDLILIDCHMPEKNGYDSTEEIRRREETTGARVPIVAMTANAMVGDREKCLRYGMDDYISKPIDADELADIIGQWIRMPEMDAHAFSAATQMEHADEPVNMALLRGMTEGDKEFERKLIRIFIEQSRLDLDKMRAQNSSSEAVEWAELAHKLKGSAAGIGATHIADLCNTAQHMAHATTEARASMFADIETAYERAVAYLEKVEA